MGAKIKCERCGEIYYTDELVRYCYSEISGLCPECLAKEDEETKKLIEGDSNDKE